MPWVPRPVLHTPASIKEGLGTGSRAWLPLEPPGKSRSISLGATGAGPSEACCVEATHSILGSLSTASLLGGLRQQQLLTEHSLGTRWCSGSVAATGLFIFASDSKRLSLVIYLPRGFVWVFIQTQPFSFDSCPVGAFLSVSNIMLQSYENSKGPSYTLQQFKTSRDLMEAQD